MPTAFGIDLGTTNSVISRLVDGCPRAINVGGGFTVPSVVLFLDDRVAVGREARNLELEFPERTVRSVKRKMGQDFRYPVQGRPRSPEEISAEILIALKQGARAATGEEVKDVVITVPAYFDDAQRRATLKAGELAGLNVLRLLNEPTSAALVYDQVGALAASPRTPRFASRPTLRFTCARSSSPGRAPRRSTSSSRSPAGSSKS
ncbi:MAG: Hsp70 family protein [Myxococcaceae bacterium]